MLDHSHFNDGHLTDYAVGLLAGGGKLSEADTYILLTHLEACDKCMDKYIDAVSTSGLETPPDGLNEKIIERVKSEKQDSNSVQVVFLNILKMGVGVSLALLLFLSGAFQKMSSAAENLIEFIAARGETSQPYQPSESSWNTFLANINSNFSDFATQWNSLFKGEIKHEQ